MKIIDIRTLPLHPHRQRRIRSGRASAISAEVSSAPADIRPATVCALCMYRLYYRNS